MWIFNRKISFVLTRKFNLFICHPPVHPIFNMDLPRLVGLHHLYTLLSEQVDVSKPLDDRSI